MIRDEHQVARLEFRVNPARSIGHDQALDPEQMQYPDREGHLLGGQALVAMKPALHDQHIIAGKLAKLATDQEQRILEFVSSQVAMVINRKRAEDSLRENEIRLRRRADGAFW